ncbi:MAG: hypothetical protein ACJ76F_14610 [Bacteroidia bacterium]
MKHVAILLSLTYFLSSCSWLSKEDPYEREQKEIKKFIDNAKILVPYKGVKIALRVNYTDTSAANLKISRTGLEALGAIASLLTKDTVSMGMADLFASYQKFKSLYDLKDEINAIEEDSLPTIFSKVASLEKALSNSAEMSSAIEKSIFGSYNNSTEHFILGALWFVSRGAPPEMYVYETVKINNDKITKPDQRLFAGLLKSVVCMEKEWYYTSEKNSSEYIDYITAHKEEVKTATSYLDSVPGADPEKRFYELRSMGYAIRAYAEDKSDRGDEARKDYDRFTEDFDNADVKNKELCFLAAYICIKNSANERAESFLKKMEQSPGYTEKDKQTVADLRGFIKNKENKEFNKYFDTFSLSKIAFTYLYNVSVNSEMAKKLKEDKAGKQVMEMPAKVNNLANYSGSLMNTDSLANKAGNLVKDLFK